MCQGIPILIQSKRFRVSDRALACLSKRDISQEAIIQVILNREIAEDYPTDKPYPCGLIL
jgi:hypothetical protein